MPPRKINTLKRWKTFLNAAEKEVRLLKQFSDLRRQFNLIVNQSPVAASHSPFWTFAHNAFAFDLVLRVCKLTERQSRNRQGAVNKKKEVYSLQALLEEILEKPEYLSRGHYLGGIDPCTFEEYLRIHPSRRSPPDPSTFNRLNTEFDKIAGKGADHISKKSIELDVAELERVTKRLKAYRNKHLAHIAVKKGKFRTPKYSEISVARRSIDKLMQKYFLLIYCSLPPNTTSRADEISDLFVEPWIASKTDRDRILEKIKLERAKAKKKTSPL
ncbi:hypothetical protein K2X30_09805 [bacterium]|nr:hypothetical protein [bacterium]